MAYDFLMKQGYSIDFCKKVKECITKHRFRSNNKPVTLEEKILFDADKLDVVGAIGIARSLMYQGKHKYPLYVLDNKGEIDLGLDKQSAQTFLKEYNYKLKNLYDKFCLKPSYKIAKSEEKVAKQFYKALLKQINTKVLDETLENIKLK